MKRRLPWTASTVVTGIALAGPLTPPPAQVHPDAVTQLTEATCSSMEGLAKCADLSPHSIWSWTSGRRSPSGESVSKLADELDRRSVELADLAKKLRDAAER